MNRWATKDHYELETDEAERLVRPAPKVKPPRRDKRREDTHPDRDPDIADDPDVAKDEDLSVNYKSVGGRVLAAFLKRLADAELIKVKHKDTGKVVKVKPETLKAKPDKYEEIDEDLEKDLQNELDKDPIPEPDEDPALSPTLMSPSDEPAPKPKLPAKPPPKPEQSEAKPEPKPEPVKPTPAVAPTLQSPQAQPAKGEKNDDFYQSAGQSLYEAAKTDLRLKGILKNLRDPQSELAGMAAHAPDMPAAPFLQGTKVPEGIETLADLQKAVLHGQRQGPKNKKSPKEKPQPAQSEGADPLQEAIHRLNSVAEKMEKALERVPPEHRDEMQAQIDSMKELGKKIEESKPPEAVRPAEPPPAKRGEPTKPLSRADQAEAQVKKIVEDFKARKEEEDPAWVAHIDALPTSARDAEGRAVFIDPKTKKEVAFDALPDSTKADLISSYQHKRHDDYTSALLASKLEGNGKAKKVIEDLFDPDSDVSSKIADLAAQGHDLDALPAKKNLPELAEVIPASIKTVADLKRLVESHADLFAKKQPFKLWEEEKGPESEEFQRYASEEAGASIEDGQLLFKVGKKRVPWARLSEDQKAQLHDNFQEAVKTDKWTEDFTTAARHDPDVAYALYQLGNPRSEVAAKLARVSDINDPIIDKVLPSLRNLGLPPGATLQDVVEIAKTAFKPVPPPERREASEDEEEAAQFHVNQAFKKYPILGIRVGQLGLHPDDVNHVMGEYQRLKAYKLKPGELEDWIKEAHDRGLYTTDPSSIPPPKAGLNQNGRPETWSKLTPEEQSEAYARHRNLIIATSLALRDMVNETFQELGVPRKLADTLALARLSRLPGESNAQRAVRARPMAAKLFDRTLASGEPEQISADDIQRTLDAIGDDPLSRSLAVAQFQANDYLQAREQFLSQTDERDPARNIAARIREASTFLNKADKLYPEEYREANTPELYRRRVMTRLMALTPEKAAEIQPEVQKMDADDYDKVTAARENAFKKWKKAHDAFKKAQIKAQRDFEVEDAKGSAGDPYRATPIKSVKDRLAEAGVKEPIPPLPIPPKPPGYDLVRKTPRGQSQSGASLWRRLHKGLTASDRVLERFLSYSSCEPGKAMGATTPSGKQAVDKSGIYWGVGPNDPASKAKAVNVPHTPWEQAHARDLSEKDYNAILASAREWMKVPVLARVLDEKDSLGAVKDIQLRAALDLAIRDLDGGKYSVGLYPTIYNNLLAQLAGQPEKGTLLTQRAASGSLYTPTQGEDRPMNAATEIRKFAAEIAAQQPGLAFDLTNLAFRVAEQEQKEQGQGKEDKKDDDKLPAFLKDKDAGIKYGALRGAVIKAAHSNPTAQSALLPVLQLLKQHQGG